MATNLYTTQTPTSGYADVFETVPVTLGTKFYVTVDDVVCTGGRFLGPSTIGVGSYELRLFEQTSADGGSATGSLKRNKTFPSLSPDVWNLLDFTDGEGAPTPFTLVKNTIYCIACATSQGRYAALLNGFLSGAISNGGITGPQTNTNPVGSGNVYNGVFGSGLVNFPNQTFNGHAYFVDPTLVFPSGVDPKKATAFMPFL